MEKITTITAIKEFFGTNAGFATKGTMYLSVTNKELLALKKVPPAEWEQLGKDCAAALGKEWESPVSA